MVIRGKMGRMATDSLKHVLSVQQFEREQLEQFFRDADQLREDLDDPRKFGDFSDYLQNRLLFNIYYEPSTRTRMSFAAAAEYLGMRVVATEAAEEFSSSAKGETLEDSTRALCEYRPAAIVMRHHETGGAERAAAVSSVPIINAGDGKGEHPTQSLLDAYIIKRELGRLDDFTLLIGGDLAHGRTARSLAMLAPYFDNVNIIFVAPKNLRIDSGVRDFLDEYETSYEETEDLEASIGEADVVYWTRMQKERFDSAKEYAKVSDSYVIDSGLMRRMKKSAVLMHPLPRVNEITVDADADPRAAYFRQAGNGLFIRMALLDWVCRP